MKQSTLLIGGLAVAGILWYRHQSATAAPATAAGLDGIASFLFGGGKKTSTESQVRAETRSWLARMNGHATMLSISSFYSFHAQKYWPYIDAELLAHGITPNVMQIAKWQAQRGPTPQPKPPIATPSPGPRPRTPLQLQRK